MTVSLDTPLTQFPGVGAVRAGKLSKLGLEKAGDLLLRYPRDYEDRRQMYSIRQAPLEELEKVVPKNTAQAVYQYFREEKEPCE